jgi:hypothetical protein
VTHFFLDPTPPQGAERELAQGVPRDRAS